VVIGLDGIRSPNAQSLPSKRGPSNCVGAFKSLGLQLCITVSRTSTACFAPRLAFKVARRGELHVNFDLSRVDVENLLAAFLVGTQGMKPLARVIDLRELPEQCRVCVQLAASRGRAWTAWSTEVGPIAAWGDYDIAASRRLNAYVLFVEWYWLPSGQNSLWCHCDPRRPSEWTIGRGGT